MVLYHGTSVVIKQIDLNAGNSRTNVIVSEYCNGVITAEEALKRIRTIKNVFQLSIHTALALKYIETAEYQQRMSNGKWSEWVKLKT